MLKQAFYYFDKGFSVIPLYSSIDGKCTCKNKKCVTPGKHPRVRWQDFTEERPTKDMLESWFTTWPDSNIGIITGEISGIAVIDVDGEKGVQSLKKNNIYEKLPKTPIVKTGGAGFHCYLKNFPGLRTYAGILDKVDIRAEGGMVVAPPSIHLSGNQYEWIKGQTLDDLEIADFDFNLIIKASSGLDKKSDQIIILEDEYTTLLEGVKKGNRNQTLIKLTGHYLARRLPVSEIIAMLKNWNLKNKPPLEDLEIEKVIKSIYRKRQHESLAEKENQKDILDKINQVYTTEGLTIKRIEKYTGEPATYIIYFDKGTFKALTNKLMSETSFRVGVAEATGIILRKRGNKVWPIFDQMLQWILDAAITIETGEEATEAGVLTDMIIDFIETQTIVPETEKIPAEGCFRQNGLIWISLTELNRHIVTKTQQKFFPTELAKLLKIWGAEHKTFYVGANSRNRWGIDENKLK